MKLVGTFRFRLGRGIPEGKYVCPCSNCLVGREVCHGMLLGTFQTKEGFVSRGKVMSKGKQLNYIGQVPELRP